MTISAWPFLVSRNRSLDYRTVVAPDFMVEADIAGQIADVAGGQPTDTPVYREIRDTPYGDLTLVYQVTLAAGSDGPFRDGFGRPILWIEGLVMVGSRQDVPVGPNFIQEVRSRVESDFLTFWDSSTTTHAIVASRAFPALEGQDIPLPARRGRVRSVETRERSAVGTRPDARSGHSAANVRSSRLRYGFLAIMLVIMIGALIFALIQTGKVSSLNDEITVLNDKITADDKDAEILNAEILNLEDAAKKSAAKIADLTAEVESIDATIMNLTAAVESKDATIVNLTVEVESRDATIATQDAQIRELRAP